MRYITVKQFHSDAVNQAIRECEKWGGGTVVLPEGIYDVTSPISLLSNVCLKGEGEKTILRKSAGVFAKLSEDADFNQRRLVIGQPGGFLPGMGIQVYRVQEEDCWGVTVTSITEVKGNAIRCAGYMNRDYPENSNVSNAFPVIAGRDISGTEVADLTVDGYGEANDFINGCRGGGIYLYRAENCKISRVLVKNFNGDGISWQTTRRVAIENCEVRGCSNFGLHPGAGSRESLVCNCRLHHNQETGLYLCWRVKNGRFLGNLIYENGKYGISIGHRDTDNRIEKNQIVKNGLAGIYFRPEKDKNAAHRNHIFYNKILDNGNGRADSSIIIEQNAELLEIRDNQMIENTFSYF